MFCKHCGNELKEKANFCSFCGTKIENEPIEEKQIIEDCQTTETEGTKELKEPKKEKTKKEFDKEELISVLFGVISLIIAPCINIFSIPMSISGVIFGSFSKSKFKKKFSVGKIISYVSMVIAVISFIFTGLLFSSIFNNNTLLHHSNNESFPITNREITKIENTINNESNNDKIKIEIPEKSKTTSKKLNDVSYNINEDWVYSGLQSINTNEMKLTTHNYNKNDAFLSIREMDEKLFSDEDFKHYVIESYGNIEEEIHFEAGNGRVWSQINTEIFYLDEEAFSTSIYYTHVNNSILIIEISNSSLVDYTDDINQIINSIK